jgi:energy-coupling factor transporter transmembrane protein EcfT
MFRVVSFTYILRYVAIATTALSIFAYWGTERVLQSDLPIIRLLSVAPWVVLIVILTITTNSTSRPIWKILKRLNSSLYPDLNGTWEGEITLEGGHKIPARAVIRQNLIESQIDLHTETSKSSTLETTPVIEAGQYKLYYTYRSSPSNLKWPSYTGSTILDVRNAALKEPEDLELSGYYYTDRKTCGRISLKQTSTRTD